MMAAKDFKLAVLPQAFSLVTVGTTVIKFVQQKAHVELVVDLHEEAKQRACSAYTQASHWVVQHISKLVGRVQMEFRMYGE